MPTEDALSRLADAAGTQLDPQVVGALLDALGARAARALRQAS